MKWPLVSALLACLASVGPTHAQWTGPSYNPFNPVIAGIPVYCTSYSGQPVAFVPNFYLSDVGRAQPGVPPTIELNPNVLAQLSPRMQLFWYGHECAHHVLGPQNSESNADCWSIRTMRDQGLLAPHELTELQAQILSSPGSIWGHLPGPQRAQLLAQCYANP
jgi:hypothetical protein